ncbi:MAG: hypothetical protein ACR2PR_12170 [Pseudohongiellaceae bacterium]
MNKTVCGVLFFLLGCQLVYAQTEDEIISVTTTDEDETVFTLRDGWEQYMNYDLEKSLVEQLSSSEQMIIYYRTLSTALWHPGFRKKEAIFDGWDHQHTFQCGRSCENKEVTSQLKEIALQSIPFETDCPAPFNMAVRLLDGEQVIVTELYFSLGGLCFTVGNQSYYSKMTLKRLSDIIDLSDIR